METTGSQESRSRREGAGSCGGPSCGRAKDELLEEKSAEVGAQGRQIGVSAIWPMLGASTLGSHAREMRNREEGVGVFQMASRP